MKSTWLDLGNHNVICDVCGFKFKASELKLRYDGMLVCEDDWEARHPLDYVRAPREDVAITNVRPEGVDSFTDITYTTSGCTATGSTSMPGFAVPGCAVPGTIQQGLL